MSSVSVTFNENHDGVYYSGQQMSGKITLKTVKKETIQRIYFELKGCGKVHWSEEKTRKTAEGSTEQYTVDYTSIQMYYKYKGDVFRSHMGQILNSYPCTLSVDFKVVLPRLPSSLEGEYGNICYEFVVTIDRLYGDNDVFRKPFFLVENVNLDDDPSNKEAIRVENVKTFTRLSGNYFIRTSCDIPMSGYFPEQQIPYHVRIENSSRKECSRSEIKFEKVVKCTATHPEIKSRTERTKIFEKELGPVKKLSNKDFQDSIELPPLPPTFTRETHIINVSYWITVRGYFTGYTSELCFPINVGTAPLPDIVTNPPSADTVQPTDSIAPDGITVPLPATNSPSVDTVQSIVPETCDPPPPYIVQNPPSYEDALGLSENVLSIQKVSFVPHYSMNHDLNVGTSDTFDMGISSAPLVFPNTDWQGASAKPD